MLFGYRLGIFFYRTIVSVASLFNEKANKAIYQRRQSIKELEQKLANEKNQIAWFHASSLGEFEQGLPVMEAYKKAYPEQRMLVTFFSPSGYELRKDHPVADYTSYLPWDSAAKAKSFIKDLNLESVFFIKYEYWYYHLREVKNRNVPLYSISALFVPQHPFFKWYGGLNRRMLKFFDHTFVQNESSRELLNSIGISKTSVAGDTRFDKVSQTINDAQPIDLIKEFKEDKELIIAGSVWSEDMAVLTNFLNNLSSSSKVLIAPHDISEGNIKRLINGLESKPVYFSKGKNDVNAQFMILDTIGHLANAYQYADLAFIGGAFGDGLHNILEAVAFGAPVVFGDQGLDKFPEAEELQKRGGAFAIKNEREASTILKKLTSDKPYRKECSKICLNYIADKKGATEVIMSYLKQANER